MNKGGVFPESGQGQGCFSFHHVILSGYQQT